jgi:hypothetical protein
MFKPGKGFCKGCEKETLIVVKKGLCGRCNEASKPKKSTTTKPNKPAKKYVKKATGEKDLFLRIWDERPHRCEVCGDDIEIPGPQSFMHILSKGAYSSLRLVPENIAIGCDSCHYQLDFGSTKDDPMFADLLKRKEKLKRKYYGSDTEI